MRKQILNYCFAIFVACVGLAASAEQAYAVEGGTVAQQSKHTVTGVVIDELDGAPVIGANVIEVGNPTNGTITDFDGKFSLKVSKSSATVKVSFIGYESQEIALGGKSTIEVALGVNASNLDEVVVTGMGIKRDRKSLGYAVSKVSGVDLVESGATSNPIQSLYGRAAGVTIRQSASGPTGGININIRGAASLQGSGTRPLFVVDGVPIKDNDSAMGSGADYGSGINDLNSEDIESLEILKGAKASVLYGSEGANGVVLITTKSGAGVENGEVSISYQYSIVQPRSFIEWQNDYGVGSNIYDVNPIKDGESAPRAKYDQYNYGPAFDSNQSRIWWDGIERPYTAQPDNFMFLFQNGSTSQVTAAVSGSSDKGNARFSFTDYTYTGIYESLKQSKKTLSFSSKYDFKSWLTVESTANIYYISTTNRPVSMLKFIVDGVDRGAPFEEFINNKDYLVTDPLDSNYGYKKRFDDAGYPTTNYYPLEEYASLQWGRENDTAQDDKIHVIAQVRPTVKFTDNLSAIAQIAYDYTSTDFDNRSRVTEVYPDLVGGSYRVSNTETTVREFKGMLTYFNNFLDDRIDFSAIGGAIYKDVKSDNLYTSLGSVNSSSPFLYPDWYHFNNQNPEGWPDADNRSKVWGSGYSSQNSQGIYGVVTATLDSEYTIELNARNDWSSTLEPGANSFFYPGIAFTWDMTNKLKFQVPSLQFGKLRASFADVGRATSAYFAYQTLEAGMVSGTNVKTANVQNEIFAGTIKPERTKELEVGFELAFLKGSRISIDASYYARNTYDQIMEVPLPSSTGATTIKINAGNVASSGYELEISGTPILTKDMRLDLNFTTANQFSKIKKLYDGITEKTISSMNGQVYVRAIEGESMGNIYGRTVQTNDDGERIVADSGETYILDTNEFVKIGNVNPNFMGGFGIDYRYKSLKFSTMLDYSFGASMFSQTNQWLYATGTSKQSLVNRDEAHGGLAYYSSNGENVALDSHSSAAPDNANVYHDGIILDGVVKNSDGSYSENTTIGSVASYYGSFVPWTNEAINAVDLQYKNEYIKIREISLAYNLPKSYAKAIFLKDVSISLFARNVGYIHRTVPNLDAEAFVGTNSFYEASPTPTTRNFGFKTSIKL